MTHPFPPTTTIADVAALHGINVCLTPPLRLLAGCADPLRATAVTVAIAPGPGVDGLSPLYDLLSSKLPDAALVVGGHPGLDAALFGQIIARAAGRAGLQAVLVHGCIRDRSLLNAEGVPVWASREATCGAVGSAHVVATRCELMIGSTPVRDGDAILCDPGGAVCLPADREEMVRGHAQELAAAEDAVLAQLAEGVPLNVAYGPKRAAMQRIQAAAAPMRA